MANGTQPMNEANDIPAPKAPPDRAIIVTIVTAIGGLAVGLVAIAIAIVAPLHGSLDNLRSDMREDRAQARADAIRIEERLNAIETHLSAIETSKAPSANTSFYRPLPGATAVESGARGRAAPMPNATQHTRPLSVRNKRDGKAATVDGTRGASYHVSRV